MLNAVTSGTLTVRWLSSSGATLRTGISAKNYCSQILFRVVTVMKRSDIGRKLFDSLGLLPFLRNTTTALM
jgi:hypothetical protein